MILRGGLGGFGNEHFKASTNVTPKEWTPGKSVEWNQFFIELELYADVGLIGLPNAGKSSLLNALTNAEAKVGDYPFTTLEPNLGDLYGFVLADIPGLVEGASENKGLGHKFLKHIRKTKFLVHLVSVENDDELHAYNTIRNELEKFDPELCKKPEIIVLSKTDIVSKSIIEEKKKNLEKKSKSKKIFALSVYEDDSLKDFKDKLIKLLRV